LRDTLLEHEAGKAPMPFSSIAPHAFQCQNALAPFLHGDALPLPDSLDPQRVQRRFAEHPLSFGHHARALWTPALTLWAFLRQVLGPDRSCRQAVCHAVLAFALTRPPDTFDTAAYCRARAKLPTALLRDLALDVGQQLEEHAAATWLWHGRHACLVDGSTSRLADTPENQRAYPQAKTQKPGLGLPIIRWVALLSLATAAVRGLAYGSYQGKQTGEPSLFRQLLGQLRPGDVVVADRYYCSYFLVALLRACGVDVVFRLHQRRRYGFRRSRRLGRYDHVVVWQRPARPAWMDEEAYARVPKTMEVREIRRRVQEAGSRVQELTLATTLADAAAFPADDIAELYHQRWQVEVDIRSLKVTLGLGDLRCLTPFMVEKELWANVLGYNLVRRVAAQAALLAERSPRSISFTASKQAVLGSWDGLSTSADGEEATRVALGLLRALAKERVGDRPGRYEPRAIKRRPKPHRLLKEPRASAKARLLKAWGNLARRQSPVPIARR
jgi:putative transposase